MKKIFLKVALFAALLNVSLTYTSCSKEEDSPAQNNQEVTGGTTDKPSDEKTDDVVLVSELKCTVAEFATKYTTLKKGEKVNVTLTDVSDNNIAQVAAILQKMSGSKLSKAGGDGYIVVLVMESKDELTKIPAEVFKDCTAMVSVSIPECVEIIESGAFDGCTALEAVKILSEVAVIQEGAFAENVKVEKGDNEVVKPEIKLLSPADIVDYVNASDEEIVTLNMALETYDHTEVMVEIEKITDKKVKLVIPDGVKELSLVNLLMGEEGLIYPTPNALVDIEIPQSVTKIGDDAFSHCISITNITIPDNVTQIGMGAFFNCTMLKSIIIPQGVSEISIGAFNGCSSLTSINIPDNVSKIASSSFYGCSSLSSITIPKNVTKIESSAFSGCSNLASVTIPNGVLSIDFEAFSYCSSLTSISIPNSVTSIGSWAFENCNNLQTIYCSQAIYDKYHETYPQMVVK